MSYLDPYVDLETFKTYMKIEITDLDDDLEEDLASATREINNHTSRNFNRDAVDATVTTRLFASNRSDLITVHDFYTTTGLIITVCGTEWAPADYQLEPLNGIRDGNPGWPFFKIRARSSSFPVGPFAETSVTAHFGWAEVPSDVKQACLMLAAETFKMREAPLGVAGWSEFGVVRVRDIPKVAKLLYPYVVDRVKMRGGSR